MNRKLSVKLGMFGACPISLLQDKTVKPNAVKVFIALMSFEGTGVESYPSREKIAERAGLSTPEKVSNAIQNLVETGWVHVIQRGKQQSNIYQCIIQSDVPETGTVPESGMPETGTTDVPKTGTGDMPETGISIVKDHLKDHLKDVGGAQQLRQILSFVQSEDVRAVLLEWIESRKTMKKPVTPIALKKAIKSLNLWYPSDIKKQVACVDRAIVGGYQGIFPLNPADVEKTTSGNGPRNMSDYIKAQEGRSAS